jgi:hypothetical protein
MQVFEVLSGLAIPTCRYRRSRGGAWWSFKAPGMCCSAVSVSVHALFRAAPPPRPVCRSAFGSGDHGPRSCRPPHYCLHLKYYARLFPQNLFVLSLLPSVFSSTASSLSVTINTRRCFLYAQRELYVTKCTSLQTRSTHLITFATAHHTSHRHSPTSRASSLQQYISENTGTHTYSSSTTRVYACVRVCCRKLLLSEKTMALTNQSRSRNPDDFPTLQLFLLGTWLFAVKPQSS